MLGQAPRLARAHSTNSGRKKASVEVTQFLGTGGEPQTIMSGGNLGRTQNAGMLQLSQSEISSGVLSTKAKHRRSVAFQMKRCCFKLAERDLSLETVF